MGSQYFRLQTTLTNDPSFSRTFAGVTGFMRNNEEALLAEG